jgi:hypothetical protein
MSVTRTLFVLTLAAGLGSTAWGQWGTSFVNQTSTRLVMSPTFQNDNLEKDFSWGDFDQDSDIDLIVVRKFPGSIQGGFPNLLLMNEGGVLVERTAEYGTQSDVVGDAGLNAPTNDRDVEAVDVNGDGWLDLVTFTTMSDQVNDVLGQPRVYRNLGDDINGNWLGFKFENARIPTLFAKNGSAANPRACDGAVADLTGDGFPDIFFVDYDTPETSGTVCIDLNGDGDTGDAGECQQSPGETASKDYDNKFLVNWGNDPSGPGPGYFFDTTNTRFTSTQLASAFGAACIAHDMNGDGHNDVVRINTLTGGQNIAVLYAKPADLGNSFSGPDQIATGAPYQLAAGDLNNDGKLDLVITDDGQDKFLINNGNGADTFANFTSYTITDSLSEFGQTIVVTDLDNDGFQDAMIADVDGDLPPFCPTTGRRAHIYRNTGGVPSNTMLDEIGQIIPNASLAATYDFAPIDINGDGWKDLIIGRCAGIDVWMNTPPIGLTYSFPGGTPATVTPGEETDFSVDVSILGGGTIVAGTLDLNYRVNGSAWTSVDLVNAGGSIWTATLPAIACGELLDYYVSGQVSNSANTFTSPATAPSTFYSASPVTGTNIAFETDFESGNETWTVTNTAVTGGAWVSGSPIGTLAGAIQVQPNGDAPGLGTNCWFTGQGVVGGSNAAADVDGGPTVLSSPAFAVTAGSPVTIDYTAWVYNNDVGTSEADPLFVQVSFNDGASWGTIRSISSTSSTWQLFSNTVLATSNSLRVRFSASDNPNNSTFECALASLKLTVGVCETAPACPADLTGDGIVDAADLANLLGAWANAGGDQDLNNDGTVDAGDLAVLLGGWGVCN